PAARRLPLGPHGPDLPVPRRRARGTTGLNPVITIERLAANDAAVAAAWDAYVLACPQATFFHRAGWLRIMREVFKHDAYFLLARRAGRICGVLPLAHVNSLLFGNALTSLPFAVYGGTAADDVESANALEQEAQTIAQRL